ncbi:hypothetical protein SAMN05421837_106338 [Amycolatopsis pretoriensis]|uniref:Uncharacterized protein n=1 Tax=Amycolatopsis pretoriensis TaxID=218821 RepID=A0A1H5R2H1_9PSEU|nr:hypothetical protein [Amycolatopsis pretoriensis]SEF32593.1 hypothetical protein SAMN05421837_106338 [Amycolatopsis pretoriensis]
MRGARVAAAVGAAALVALGCSGCRDNLVGSPSDTAPASSELSGVESTLNGIESDMNSDGSP